MSEVVTLKLKITNLLCLNAAAQAKGLEMREQKAFNHYAAYDGQTCDYALCIPNKPGAYEVGVKQQADGSYTLLMDDMDHGGLHKLIGGKAGIGLLMEYQIQEYMQTVQLQHPTAQFERYQEADGRLVAKALYE